MAVPYQTVMRQIALGAGMLRGDSTIGLQTSYEDPTLNQWDLINDGEKLIPLTALQDACLNAESVLANAIADTGGHPWRSYILSFTANLSNGDVMPSADSNGNPIIGIYGSVLDSDDQSLICTEWPTEMIRRWSRMSSYYKSSFYGYAVDGNGITHTRPNGVVVQVCVYNRATQLADLIANEDILLPDTLAPAMVSGALAMLGGENAGLQRSLFDQTLMAIKSGLTSVPNVDLGGGATLVPQVSS